MIATPYVKRLLQPSLQRKLELDKRQPILLLRAFRRDHTIVENDFLFGTRTFEEKVVKQLKKVGPVIALGSPKDFLRPVGASREYVSIDDWQSTVRRLLDISQFVVFMIDFSDSLEWELNLVKDRAIEKLVVIFIHWILFGEDRRAWLQSYRRLRERKIDIFQRSATGLEGRLLRV